LANAWLIFCGRVTSKIAIFVVFHHNETVTIWLFNIAMENGPFIDGLPIKNGDFP
jgi:hypothetical protein